MSKNMNELINLVEAKGFTEEQKSALIKEYERVTGKSYTIEKIAADIADYIDDIADVEDTGDAFKDFLDLIG